MEKGAVSPPLRANGMYTHPKREEDVMGATGIGAPVRRKEDQRFITGKGHYTDDINRPGQTYACFVRSPHAHAKIKTIDARRRTACPACSRCSPAPSLRPTRSAISSAAG